MVLKAFRSEESPGPSRIDHPTLPFLDGTLVHRDGKNTRGFSYLWMPNPTGTVMEGESQGQVRDRVEEFESQRV